MSTVLVTGGTGHLGRELVPRLQGAGHTVRVLSRSATPTVPAGVAPVQGDLRTGAGLEAAVAGVDLIAHLATDSRTIATFISRVGKRSDVDGTQRLLDAAKRAGSPHILYISIVGIDTIPYPYYKTKLATEAVIRGSGLPHTILRTTQWHTLAWDLCEKLTRPPIVVVPKSFRGQLLDVGEVAERMVLLAAERPDGFAPDMGGPHSLDIADIVRSYLSATGKSRSVRSVGFPGKAMAAFRRGDNLTPDHADGTITWQDWLSRVT